ncbi:probable chitinase 10 [Nephila pilipes]|uniref:Probable chitinase 10 n=1 Tax=Nephila pilipes TaxID=299642 RepID=A0A8X6NE64_NEPPI|nr:probable chitinase 10 [Nephila pilipes]
MANSFRSTLIFMILQYSFVTGQWEDVFYGGSSYPGYQLKNTYSGAYYTPGMVSHSFRRRSLPETYSSNDRLKGRRIVCLYNNVNYYKIGFTPMMIDPNLCTHINYEFAMLDPKTYELMPSEPAIDLQENFYDEAVALKEKNPNLKVLLSLGGWADSSKKYSELVELQERIDNFVNKVVPFLKAHGFDGLDVAWEYPNCWQGALGVSTKDKDNYVTFLQALRKQFDIEGFILSVSVTAIEREIKGGYNVPAVSDAVHHINVMTYDMHGPWEAKTGHHTQFETKAGDEDPSLNTKAAMELWANEGVPKMKLNMGIATYAKTFTLANAANHEYGAPTVGKGKKGYISQNEGTLCYNEICQYLNAGNWTEGEDKQRGFYAYSGDQWACYDPPLMVVRKVKWLAENGYGGILIKDLSCDDYEGLCFSMPFPLISMMKMEFESKLRKY